MWWHITKFIAPSIDALIERIILPMTFKDMLSHNKVAGRISYFQEKGMIVSHILYEIIHIGRNNDSLLNLPVIIQCDVIILNLITQFN